MKKSLQKVQLMANQKPSPWLAIGLILANMVLIEIIRKSQSEA